MRAALPVVVAPLVLAQACSLLADAPCSADAAHDVGASGGLDCP